MSHYKVFLKKKKKNLKIIFHGCQETLQNLEMRNLLGDAIREIDKVSDHIF